VKPLSEQLNDLAERAKQAGGNGGRCTGEEPRCAGKAECGRSNGRCRGQRGLRTPDLALQSFDPGAYRRGTEADALGVARGLVVRAVIE
jgi:hypothetical protein